MTIDTGHTQKVNIKKRPLEQVDEDTPKKRQKTAKGERTVVEKILPFQGLFSALIERCCDVKIDVEKRKSNFHILFLENPSSNHFVLSILHIIHSHPNHSPVLVECVAEAEEFLQQLDQLTELLNGEFDRTYLMTIDSFSKLQEKELENQRKRFIANINGLMLKKLKKNILHSTEDDLESCAVKIQRSQYWFQVLQQIPHNGLALSVLINEYSDTLDQLLYIKGGAALSIPWHLRSFVWQFNIQLIQLLTNCSMGRSYFLAVLKEYVTHSDQYESRLFFSIILEKSSSSLRNCLSETLLSQPWFLQLTKEWMPTVINLIIEIKISPPDIQYNCHWKKEVRNVMQQSSMRGLDPSQKQVLAWALSFANNSVEFWYYLAENNCLYNYLSKLDIEVLKSDTSQQIALADSLILARSLMKESSQELSKMIEELAGLFPYIREKHFPNLMFRFCQHLLREKKSVPKFSVGMSFYHSKKNIEFVIQREYQLMDSFFKLLSNNSRKLFPSAGNEFVTYWRDSSMEVKCSLVNNLIEKSLNLYQASRESCLLPLAIMDKLDDQEEIDFFIETLWDEGLLNEQFSVAFLSLMGGLIYPDCVGKIQAAINRHVQSSEIREELGTQPFFIFF
jgi:hypothetical protein